MKNVHPEKKFYFKNGMTAQNLSELVQGIQQMNDEEFKHHVNDEKNDFARWIKDVVEDHELAKKVDYEKDQKAIIEIVTERINRLEKEVGPVEDKKKDIGLLKDLIMGIIIGLIIGIILGKFLL